MITVLNCGGEEELRRLRHEILREGAEVVSLELEGALAEIRSKQYDVLVLCHRVAELADSLCFEFRRINPRGRIVVIQGPAPMKAMCEPDLIVDGLAPRALMEAVVSYADARPKFKHDRRLSRHASGKFVGWSCDRCCWHRQEPGPLVKRDAYVGSVEMEFQAHSCEAFARQEWTSGPEPVETA